MDISVERVAALQTAIELGVDDDDFRFASHNERVVWFDLLAEHEARVDMCDSLWTAAA